MNARGVNDSAKRILIDAFGFRIKADFIDLEETKLNTHAVSEMEYYLLFFSTG